jgi:hypothetical protein
VLSETRLPKVDEEALESPRIASKDKQTVRILDLQNGSVLLLGANASGRSGN